MLSMRVLSSSSTDFSVLEVNNVTYNQVGHPNNRRVSPNVPSYHSCHFCVCASSNCLCVIDEMFYLSLGTRTMACQIQGQSSENPSL
jgi:hypothetical protein